MLVARNDSETDRGPQDRAGPERLCIVSRTVKPIAEMIRFVVGPDGVVVADLKHRLPGRGVWVTATREALATAMARNAFARGFKRPVRVPGDVVEATARLLARGALDALSIARKAGLVQVGFTRAEAAVRAGDAVALIHASDGADNGVRKLAAAAKRCADDAQLPRIELFTSAQLGLALGRSNVIHAALLAGPASETFLARYHSLQRFGGVSQGGPRSAIGADQS